MRMRRKKWTEPVLDNCPFLIEDPTEHKGHWKSVFKDPDKPLMLEIGCGKGVSTVKMTHDNPENNYLAVDLVRHVLAVTIKNAMAEYGDDPIDNLALTAINAEYCTDTLSIEDGIKRIYISFPNPWNDKSKQHKKRLTHPRQLLQYRTFLPIGGEIYFKTDDTYLFEASKRYLSETGFRITYITDDLQASGFTPNYVSEHEQKYMDMGTKIHFLIAVMEELPEDHVNETEGRGFEMNRSPHAR